MGQSSNLTPSHRLQERHWGDAPPGLRMILQISEKNNLSLKQKDNTKDKRYRFLSICGIYTVNFPVLCLCVWPGASTLPPSLPGYSFFSAVLGTLSLKQTLHIMPEKKEAFNILGHAFPSAPLSQLFKEVKRVWQCLGFGNTGQSDPSLILCLLDAFQKQRQGKKPQTLNS